MKDKRVSRILRHRPALTLYLRVICTTHKEVGIIKSNEKLAKSTRGGKVGMCCCILSMTALRFLSKLTSLGAMGVPRVDSILPNSELYFATTCFIVSIH